MTPATVNNTPLLNGLVPGLNIQKAETDIKKDRYDFSLQAITKTDFFNIKIQLQILKIFFKSAPELLNLLLKCTDIFPALAGNNAYYC